MVIKVNLGDLVRVLRKLTPDLVAQPLARFMQRAATLLQNKARLRSPVDTGRLRASILTEIDAGTPPLWAKAGTNVFYGQILDAPFRRNPHYRAGPFAGAPTAGWMTEGAAGDAEAEVGKLVGQLGEEIAEAWEA